MAPEVPDFTPRELQKIEATCQELGRWLFDHIPRHQPTVFQRQWWDDQILSWAMRDEAIKVQAFRFIDVLPMLHSAQEVVQHLQEYFEEVRQRLPAAARLGLAVASPRSFAGRVLALAARRHALDYARRFIAGTTPQEVLQAVRRARRQRMAFTLDWLGEMVVSEQEADSYLQSYLDLIRHLAPAVNRWPEVPQIDRGVLDALPRVNVSVKLSALDSQFDPADPQGTLRRVGGRLRQLLRVARQHRAFVNVDMESYATKELTLWIVQQVLMEEEFRDTGDVGVVIQCYLKDSRRDLERLLEWVRRRGHPIWVRLVKGAYWDYEVIHARYHNWPVPVYLRKWQTDANYEAQTRFLLRHYEHLRPALASHNLRSLAYGIAVARHIGLPISGMEIQMLYGMADAEKELFRDLGYRVRVYMPFGELIPGMAYLVRRLLENTSNDSFLRASFTELRSPEELLRPPEETGRRQRARQAPAGTEPPAPDATEEAVVKVPPFPIHPPLDFAREENRRRMQAAVEQVAGKLGGRLPLVIAGQEVETDQELVSLNPSHKQQVVAHVAAATARHAQQAVEQAAQAWPQWAATPVEERAALLEKLAELIASNRFELAAWMVHESGKNWREADADVCEAIDFCRYYAQGARHLMGKPLALDVAGEENRYHYRPRGVAAVVAPWNFPLSILTGMTTAALVTGNTVVMKPAEQSPAVAYRLMQLILEAGFPPAVCHYLPGVGEEVGAALVEHPLVVTIAFTGSRAVGMEIHRRAAEVSAQGLSPEVKRVIAEMGGKNAIIVDADADLDEAVAGVIKSAFGFQGQKCSACSRAIVLEQVYEPFVRRLVEATQSLTIGPAEDPGNRLGPVIDQDAFQRIGRYIEQGRRDGKELLHVDVGPLAEEGYYVGPTIFAELPRESPVAREEIFGPVLAVFRASDLDEALRLANDVPYALTGGIYSRSPRNLRRAAQELQAGNVYLNRPITGAIVGRQPFGGYRHSGIGSKAGGPDYLLQFVIPRTVTENTMRRGFAPHVEEAAEEGE